MYPTKSDTYEAFKNGKTLYRDVFLTKNNQKMSNFLYGNYYSKMNKGDRLFIVELKDVAFFDEIRLENIVLDSKAYQRVPFLYLVSSYTRNYSVKKSKENLSYKGHYETGSWMIYLFEKV